MTCGNFCGYGNMQENSRMQRLGLPYCSAQNGLLSWTELRSSGSEIWADRRTMAIQMVLFQIKDIK